MSVTGVLNYRAFAPQGPWRHKNRPRNEVELERAQTETHSVIEGIVNVRVRNVRGLYPC